MNLNERNYAGDHLVVGSIKVLGNIEGSDVTEIKRNVDLIKDKTQGLAKQQDKYWEELSDDGVISSLEKQMLLKESKNIQFSYTAIYTQVLSLGLETSQIFLDYNTVFQELNDYLYQTLKLFDDMAVPTEIEDREAFNQKFSNYYYDESFLLIALSKDILATVNMRVLQNLNETGEENEVALYKGGLYQYIDGVWTAVNKGNYKGALNYLPVPTNDDFFLASDNFEIIEPLIVNGEILYVNNDVLNLTRGFRKGYIYYCEDENWKCEFDKTNYRYVAAFADVLNVTGELPAVFQDALDELSNRIDSLSDEVTNIQKAGYRGASSVPPANPVEGDFFVYGGQSTANWRRSDVYRYENGKWERLSPYTSENRSYYMQALEDILALNVVQDGYFAAVFAQSFFSNMVSTESLSTRSIILKEQGAIASDVYTEHTRGFRLSADGSADFSGSTYIGENAEIKGLLFLKKIVVSNILYSYTDQNIVFFEMKHGMSSGGGYIEKDGMKINTNSQWIITDLFFTGSVYINLEMVWNLSKDYRTVAEYARIGFFVQIESKNGSRRYFYSNDFSGYGSTTHSGILSQVEEGDRLIVSRDYLQNDSEPFYSSAFMKISLSCNREEPIGLLKALHQPYWY